MNTTTLAVFEAVARIGGLPGDAKTAVRLADGIAAEQQRQQVAQVHDILRREKARRLQLRAVEKALKDEQERRRSMGAQQERRSR